MQMFCRSKNAKSTNAFLAPVGADCGDVAEQTRQQEQLRWQRHILLGMSNGKSEALGDRIVDFARRYAVAYASDVMA
jgi:hypothetical protein